MKRDPELATRILLELEELPPTTGWHDVEVEGHSNADVWYQTKLLADAGLIEAIDLSTKDGFCWKPKTLTSAGHDFLEKARESRWRDTVKAKGGDLTFEAIKTALQMVLRGEWPF